MQLIHTRDIDRRRQKTKWDDIVGCVLHGIYIVEKGWERPDNVATLSITRNSTPRIHVVSAFKLRLKEDVIKTLNWSFNFLFLLAYAVDMGNIHISVQDLGEFLK